MVNPGGQQKEATVIVGSSFEEPFELTGSDCDVVISGLGKPQLGGGGLGRLQRGCDLRSGRFFLFTPLKSGRVSQPLDGQLTALFVFFLLVLVAAVA